jgi:hypothetical protein
MKYRIITAIILAFVVLNLGGSTFADTKAKKARSSELVAMLPESDAVVTFDVKRFFGGALPQLLANNQALLAEVTGHLDEIKGKVGIDIRQFDDVAVGASARQIAAKNYDIDLVVIARGQMTSAALIGAAKLASNAKYREERVGERVMYIFNIEKVATQTKQNVTVFGAKMTEVAVASLDGNTVAFGEPGRVRQTLEGKTRVGSDLTTMLQINTTAIAAFAVKPPAGLKAYLPLENDELGKTIDSIKYFYGHANVTADSAIVHVTARTLQNAQATSLHETLEGLQMLGKAFLGSAKAADKKAYARLIETVKFSVKANEVSIDLSVPQSDIDILVGSLK